MNPTRGFGRFAALVFLLVVLMLPSTALGAPNDNVLPGVPAHRTEGVSGNVSAADTTDVYWVQLQADEELTIRWHGQPGLSVNMLVLSPTATSASDPALQSSTSVDGAVTVMHYGPAPTSGRYYLIVRRTAGEGYYVCNNYDVTTDRTMGISLHGGSKVAYMSTERTKDRWVLWVRKYRTVTINLSDPFGIAGDFDMLLYADDGTGAPKLTSEMSNGSTADATSMTYAQMSGDPPTWSADDYAPLYLDITRFAGSGVYTLSWSVEPSPAYYERIAGPDRFATANQMSIWSRWPFDEAVSDVVVACGDDAAATDPLAASGLCWAYDAPLLLVSKNAARNSDTYFRLSDMAAFNGHVRVHVVGGTNSVTSAVYDDIEDAVGGSSYVERINGTDRYDLARAIAARMRNVRSDHVDGALFANGADSTKFFDAAALGAISANTGMPILLVAKDAVPSATKSAINSLAPSTRIAAGGTATISTTTLATLGATRVSGVDRYWTAKAVADKAISEMWLRDDHVALASKLPDALSAGAAMGYVDGPLLLVAPTSLPNATRQFLLDHDGSIQRLWPMGGTASISDTVIYDATGTMP